MPLSFLPFASCFRQTQKNIYVSAFRYHFATSGLWQARENKQWRWWGRAGEAGRGEGVKGGGGGRGRGDDQKRHRIQRRGMLTEQKNKALPTWSRF